MPLSVMYLPLLEISRQWNIVPPSITPNRISMRTLVAKRPDMRYPFRDFRPLYQCSVWKFRAIQYARPIQNFITKRAKKIVHIAKR